MKDSDRKLDLHSYGRSFNDVYNNHPSGNLTPSQADLIATKKLIEAGKVLGIPVMDHLIFHAGEVYSIRTESPDLFS